MSVDSRLDSLFRATFQPAQQIDARLDIRREEPENEQKKKNKKEKDESGEYGEDITTLSVVALHEFLKNLLQQAGGQFIGTAGETLQSHEGIPEDHAPIDPASAKAAQAYQTTARATPGRSIDFSDHGNTAQPQGQTPQGPAIELGAEDLRIIHTLIEDVEALGKRGIAEIAIHPAESFLQSLVMGVKEASDKA